MFEAWGRVIYRHRRLVLILSVAVVAFAGLWGTKVFSSLQTAGGFTVPNSESQQAADLASAAFGHDQGDVVVLYSSDKLTVTDPAFMSAVTKAESLCKLGYQWPYRQLKRAVVRGSLIGVYQFTQG